jgi:hypothetical protein
LGVDFPVLPIIGPGAPADAAGKFTGNPSGTPPCIVEPEAGALYLYNWLRPRIRWTGTSGLTQIIVHADQEANDLIAYTTASSWVMPYDVWAGLTQHVHEADITVTVRAANGGASTVAFQIASAGATGSIEFFSADPLAVGNQGMAHVKDTDAFLQGFAVGEDSTVDVLEHSQVQQTSRDQAYQVRKPVCMGCHAATPDPLRQ